MKKLLSVSNISFQSSKTNVICKIDFFDKSFILERKYKEESVILPIGCNCQPTHFLSRLHIRNQSLPFDWLLVLEQSLGLHYVYQNIKENFQYFMAELKIIKSKVTKGETIVSSHYPYVSFFHERDLIQSQTNQEKLRRRCRRFLNLVKEKKCKFLYTVGTEYDWNKKNIERLLDSIYLFVKSMKTKDSLHIYLEYHESFDENEKLNLLFKELTKIELPKLYIARYITEKKVFGIWGDETKYVQLMQNLNFKIKSKLIPHIRKKLV